MTSLTLSAADMIMNGLGVYTGIDSNEIPVYPAVSMEMVPNMAQLLLGYEMSINFVTSMYNYVNSSSVSILNTNSLVTQYILTAPANTTDVSGNYTMTGSCAELITKYGSEIPGDIIATTTQANVLHYFYQRVSTKANTVLQDSCYLIVSAPGFTVALSVNVTYSAYLASVSQTDIAYGSEYVAGQIRNTNNNNQTVLVYQTGLLLTASNTSYTGALIGNGPSLGKPSASLPLGEFLAGSNYSIPEQMYNYATIGGINLLVNPITVAPRVEVNSTVIATILVLNIIPGLIVLRSLLHWKTNYFSKPLEVIISNAAIPGNGAVDIGIRYNGRGKHITATCHGLPLVASDLMPLPEKHQEY